MVNQSGVTGYGRTIQSAGDVSSHQESEISPLLAQSISKVQNVVTLLKKDSQQSEIDSHVEEGIFSKLWSWTNQKMYTAVQYVQETFVPMEVVEESFADEQVDSRLPIQQDICLDEEWMPEKSEVEEDGDWKEAVESEWVKQETISRSEEPTSIAKEEESTSWSKTISSTLYSVLPRPATEEDEMRVDSLASVPPGIPDESEHQGLLSKAFEASLDGMQTTLTAASKMVQGVKQEAVKIAGKAAIKAFGYLGEFREEKKKLEADLLKIVKDEKVVRSISNIVSSPLHRLIDAVRKEPKLSSALSSSTTLVQEDGALSASGELMLFALEDSEIQCLLTNQLLHVTTEVYKIVDQIQAEMVLKFATDCLKNATKVPHESLISEEDFEGIASTEQMVRKIKENVVALLFPHGAQDIKLGAFSQIQEAQLLKEIVYERVEQGIGLLVTQITTQLVSVEMRQELAIQGAKLAADTIEGMVADKEGVVASAKKVLQTSSSSVANADAQQVVEFTHQLKQVTRALLQVVTSQKVAKKLG